MAISSRSANSSPDRTSRNEHTRKFNNHNGVVTGGIGGIGLATACRMALEGGAVLVTGRHEGHFGRFEEVVAAAAFLLSSDAGYITATGTDGRRRHVVATRSRGRIVAPP